MENLQSCSRIGSLLSFRPSVFTSGGIPFFFKRDSSVSPPCASTLQAASLGMTYACFFIQFCYNACMINTNIKSKILLIEDEEMLASMYKTKFEKDGLEVEIASDGEAGVEKARNGE